MESLVTFTKDIQVNCGANQIRSSRKGIHGSNKLESTPQVIKSKALRKKGAFAIKCPLHVIEYFAEKGRLRELAFFLSLKKVFKTNHFHNYKTTGFNKWKHKLKYPISYPTYQRYLATLCRMGIANGDGKGGMTLFSKEKLEAWFPTDKKLRIIRLKNDEDLVYQLQQVILDYNGQGQHYEIESSQKDLLVQKQITKTMDGSTTISMCDPSDDISLSCQKFANKLGYKCKATGHRKLQRMINDGIIRMTRRREYLGHRKQLKELLSTRPFPMFTTDKGFVYRVYAREFEFLKPNWSKTGEGFFGVKSKHPI